MAPKSSSKAAAGHDDAAKTEHAGSRDRGAPSTGASHSSSKLRRVASSTGTQGRDAPPAANATSATAAAAGTAAGTESIVPAIQWSTFDREMLHTYRREHRLPTPTAFSCSYHQLILSRPGGIGLYSPTMARRRQNRLQSKEQLAMAVRKHFNGAGVQENDVIAEFIHKVRSQADTRLGRARRLDADPLE